MLNIFVPIANHAMQFDYYKFTKFEKTSESYATPSIIITTNDKDFPKLITHVNENGKLFNPNHHAITSKYLNQFKFHIFNDTKISFHTVEIIIRTDRKKYAINSLFDESVSISQLCSGLFSTVENAWNSLCESQHPTIVNLYEIQEIEIPTNDGTFFRYQVKTMKNPLPKTYSHLVPILQGHSNDKFYVETTLYYIVDWQDKNGKRKSREMTFSNPQHFDNWSKKWESYDNKIIGYHPCNSNWEVLSELKNPTA